MRCRRTAAAVTLGLTAVPTSAALLAAPAEDAVARTPVHDSLESAIVQEVNRVRAQARLHPVRASRVLARRASRQSGIQLNHRRIEHARLTSRGSRRGETIAWTGRGTSAGQVVAMWMRSPSHRKQLLTSVYRRIGVGQRRGSMAGRRGRIYTVQLAAR